MFADSLHSFWQKKSKEKSIILPPSTLFVGATNETASGFFYLKKGKPHTFSTVPTHEVRGKMNILHAAMLKEPLCETEKE